MHLTVANAGTPVASIDVDPSGNITEQNNGNLTAQVGGNLSATIAGTTNVTSTGDATLKAPNVTIDSPQTTCTGKLTVAGLLTYEDGLSGTGNAAITGGDVTADGIGLKGHHHDDPQGGETSTAKA